MTTLPERVLPHVPSDPILVALSGGLDSCALLHILAGARTGLFAAHVHHGLRDEADSDEAFCRERCQTLGVGFQSARIRFNKGTGSLQHRARAGRYAALARMARTVGARYVVTAHHQDDILETAALMWTRGAGLASVPQPRAPYPVGLPGLELVRPMLEISRAELEAWVHERGITWVEDASNASDAYLRNRLRHHVLPAWLEAPGARSGALATLANVRADEDALSTWAGNLFSYHTHWSTPGHVRINLEVAHAPDAVLARFWGMLARRLPTRPRWSGASRETLNELMRETPNAAAHLPGARACISREALVVEAVRARGARDLDARVATPVPLTQARTPWYEGALELTEEDSFAGLVLRGPRPGDKTRRGRKLGELLRGLGVHPTQRWRWPCVAREDGELVWAVGDEEPGGDVSMKWTWGDGGRDSEPGE